MGCSSSTEEGSKNGAVPNRLQRSGGTLQNDNGLSAVDRNYGHENGDVKKMGNPVGGAKTREEGSGTNQPTLSPSRNSQFQSNGNSATANSTNITPPGIWPRIVTISSSPPLTIHIYQHTISNPPRGSVPCISYISSGLRALNQPEIIFTLQLRANEDPNNLLTFPIEWIKVIHAITKAGIHLEVGQLVELAFRNDGTLQLCLERAVVLQDAEAWRDMRRFGGLVHGEFAFYGVLKVPSAAIPKNAHHVIALTYEEAAVAKQFGPTRVIGHVGLAVRWFPYPPMVDRDREGDCVTMADQAGSVRSAIPLARLYGISVVVVDGDIVMTIPEGEEKRDAFKKYVLDQPLVAAVGFDAFMAKGADSGMVWKAGQKEPRGYGRNTGPVEVMNQCFITFAPEQSEDRSIMVEDGYGILLQNATWNSIREAIRQTQDITVNLNNGMRFRLEWKKTVYHNPIDGQEYHADWRTYSTASPADLPPDNSHVKLESMVLLKEPRPDEINAREFLTYIERIIEVLKEVMPVEPIPLHGSEHLGRQLLIEIELPKREGWLKTSASPSPNGLPLNQALPKIAQLIQPETKVQFTFQMALNLWGFEGQSAHFS